MPSYEIHLRANSYPKLFLHGILNAFGQRDAVLANLFFYASTLRHTFWNSIHINYNLITYIKQKILLRYEHFDTGHQRNHADEVRDAMMASLRI